MIRTDVSRLKSHGAKCRRGAGVAVRVIRTDVSRLKSHGAKCRRGAGVATARVPAPR